MPNCEACSQLFVPSKESVAFLNKVAPKVEGRLLSIPPPRLCPSCRLQRRLTFRNQIYIYTRPSFFSGKKIFSAYPEESPGRFIDREEWWGDSWDAESYGRAFDFSRPFFEQCQELALEVPHLARSCLKDENCDYCNNITGAKDCYLVFNTADARDCWYCENVVKSVNCIDCTHSPNCELCYDCVGCSGCYGLQESLFCTSCSDSFLLSHCRGCRNCFACANLSRQEHCVFNQLLTKTEYASFIEKADLGSWSSRRTWNAKVLEFFKTQPRPHLEAAYVENVSGNFIFESKNVEDSFVVRNGENLRWCFNTVAGVRDCQDFTGFGNGAELIYDSANCGSGAYQLIFCDLCWGGSSQLAYCRLCAGCSDCFGCVSLKKKQYGILNRIYRKDEYETLVSKIVDHMAKTGEWGEFFPARQSLFPYNETYAQRIFPLSRTEALSRGLLWHDRGGSSASGAEAVAAIPDRLPDHGDSLVVRSERSGRSFRITADEIRKYRALNVPLPRKTYDERMEDRARWVDRVRLYPDRCRKTGKDLMSAVAPEDGWLIWDREVFERQFFS